MQGFNYSKAMQDKRAAGFTWTFDNLDHFLTSPRAFIPGTAMTFAGLPKPEDRANVIAYVRTLSDNPVPIPPPPAATPAAAPAAPAAGTAAPAARTPAPAAGTPAPAAPAPATPATPAAPAPAAPAPAAPAPATPAPPAQ
jgi:cytochrome c